MKRKISALLYCARYNRFDCVVALSIFLIVFIFSLFVGNHYYINKRYGYWYQNYFSQYAISLYDTGEVRSISNPNQELTNFCEKGSLGSSAFNELVLTEQPKQIVYCPAKNSFATVPGIPWLLAKWWKFIGRLSWSEVYILLSLVWAGIAVAAYFAFRQVGGLIPSTILTLVCVLPASLLDYAILNFRDSIRALFGYLAIGLFFFLLKPIFSWKRVVCSSLLLASICFCGLMFRNDFVILLPFIAIAIIFFHGKRFYSLWSKKILLLSCMVIPLCVSSNLKKSFFNGEHYANNHVYYIGLSFTDNLHCQSSNCFLGTVYSDSFGFKLAEAENSKNAKAGEVVKPYSKAYDRLIKHELYSLFRMYPYDFALMTLSASISTLQYGIANYNEKRNYYREHINWAKEVYDFTDIFLQNTPRWICILFSMIAIVILVFGHSFIKPYLILFAMGALSGVYVLQYDARHYAYWFIISLLAATFVFAILIRLLDLLLSYRKRLYVKVLRKKRYFLTRLFILSCFVLICLSTMLGLRIYQNWRLYQEYKTILALDTNPTEFSLSDESQSNSSLDNTNNLEQMIEVRLSDFLNGKVYKTKPQQSFFCEFLLCEFDFPVDTDCMNPFTIETFYQYPNEITYKTGTPRFYNTTLSFPMKVNFQIKGGKYLLLIPVYFGPKSAPFAGFRISRKYLHCLTSVKRIINPEQISNHSIILFPIQNVSKQDFCRKIIWKEIFDF